MSELTEERVEHLAHLARLELSVAEKEALVKEMSSAIQFVQKLSKLEQELNENDVRPTSHILSVHNVFREDQVHASLTVEEVFKNAADQKHNQFKVPSILEG